MPRWYAAFSIRRVPPTSLLQQISTIVRRHDLGRWVPRVCFERGASGEYYFAMAIESENPGEPPRALDPLLQLSALSVPVHAPGRPRRLEVLTRADLQRFMTLDLEVTPYAPVLHAAELRRRPPADPFAVADEETVVSAEGDERSDRLLAWVSAYGSGSVDVFRAACAALDLSDPARLLRSLRLLGHAEQSPDGHHWSATPTTLVRVASVAERTFVLAGARDWELLAELDRLATVTRISQPTRGPACVRITGLTEGQVAELTAVEVAEDAALQLVSALPTFEEWRASLVRVRGVLPTLFDVYRLEGDRFVPVPFDHRTGFYELRPRSQTGEDASGRPYLVAYYDAETGEWLRGEWYALRYLTVAGTEEPFLYDVASRRVACLRERRLPEIHERALVLSSGLLPRLESGWLFYESVEPQVAELLLARLTPRP